MVWFKKKKEVAKHSKEGIELPELPKMPELAKFPESPEFPVASKLPELPEPKSGFEAPEFPEIKSLPASPQTSPIFPVSSAPKIKPVKGEKTLEIADWEESLSKKAPEMPLPPGSLRLPKPKLTAKPPVPIAQPKPIKKIEPFYIRLDKFKSAIKSFTEIKSRIFEIETLLKNIQEVNRKENAELSEWEREIETIKARIEALDQSIFSQFQ